MVLLLLWLLVWLLLLLLLGLLLVWWGLQLWVLLRCLLNQPPEGQQGWQQQHQFI
jgi:hypothetical protein